MTIYLTDNNAVGETEGTLFSMLQQGNVDSLVIIKNAGTNTINYRFQEHDGSSWADMGATGSDLNTTLTAAQVRSFKVKSSFPRVRLLGNASGGSTLEFDLARYFDRTSGGEIPLLSL